MVENEERMNKISRRRRFFVRSKKKTKLKNVSHPHLSPISSAVALATRNTIAGLSLFPPAPKICSAAAWSMGCLSPTMPRRLAFICSMSAATGARMVAEDAVLSVDRVSGGEEEDGGDGEGVGKEGGARESEAAVAVVAELLLLDESVDFGGGDDDDGAAATAATAVDERGDDDDSDDDKGSKLDAAFVAAGTRNGPATPPRFALISL